MFVRPLQAAADAATAAVAGTRFVSAGSVSAAHALRVRKYAESGRLGPSASGLAQQGAVAVAVAAAAGNYGETDRLSVTSSLVLCGVHAVAEGQSASLRTVWAPRTTYRSFRLSVRVSSG